MTQLFNKPLTLNIIIQYQLWIRSAPVPPQLNSNFPIFGTAVPSSDWHRKLISHLPASYCTKCLKNSRIFLINMALQSLRFAGTFSRNLFQWNLTKSASIVGAQFRGIKQSIEIIGYRSISIRYGRFLIQTYCSVLVLLFTENIISSLFLVVQTDAVNGDSVIEGLTLTSNRFNQLVKVDEADHAKSCYMCKLNLDLKHTVSFPLIKHVFKIIGNSTIFFSGCSHIEPVHS